LGPHPAEPENSVNTPIFRGKITTFLLTLCQEFWCQGAPGTAADHLNRIIHCLIDDLHAIPSIQVLAGMDAAMILSKRQLKAHDMRDLMHAAVAVPNCDAFFCDKHIASLLTTSPLQFDKAYKTKVLSRPEEIVDYLAAVVKGCG